MLKGQDTRRPRGRSTDETPKYNFKGGRVDKHDQGKEVGLTRRLHGQYRTGQRDEPGYE